MQTADRQQMCQPRIPHRDLVSLGYAPAIPAGECGGNRARRSADPRHNMPGKTALKSRKSAGFRRGMQDLEWPHYRSRRRQPLEPRGTSKVIAARQHRRGGRHKARAQPHHRAFRQPEGHALYPKRGQGNNDPHLARCSNLDIAHRQRQPQSVVRWLILTLKHRAVELHDRRPRNRLGADQFRSGPDHADAECEDETASEQCEPQIAARPICRAAWRPECERPESKPGSQSHRRAPLPRARQDEPRHDPACKHHRQPRCAVESCARQERFSRLGKPRRNPPLRPAPGAGLSAAGLPRARRDIAISGIAAARFVSHRYDRHIAQGSSPDRPSPGTVRSQAAQSEQELKVNGKRKQREWR
jgi:hypothetical protein